MSSCKTTVTLTETNNLGGPFRGYSAPQTKSGFKTAEQVISRRVLRDSWNNALVSGAYKGQKASTGSFRLVNNLGDFLGRQNYSCGGPNQISSSKTGTTSTIGSIPQQCDTTGIPPASFSTSPPIPGIRILRPFMSSSELISLLNQPNI